MSFIAGKKVMAVLTTSIYRHKQSS